MRYVVLGILTAAVVVAAIPRTREKMIPRSKDKRDIVPRPTYHRPFGPVPVRNRT